MNTLYCTLLIFSIIMFVIFLMKPMCLYDYVNKHFYELSELSTYRYPMIAIILIVPITLYLLLSLIIEEKPVIHSNYVFTK